MSEPPPYVPRRTDGLVSSGGILAAALGVLALAGWAFGFPFLADFGSRNIPMAPSTAVLFIGYGVALAGVGRRQAGKRTRIVAIAVAALGGATAALLLLLNLTGVQAKAEHLGFAIGGEVAGSPVGFMSPLTATGFILSSVALVAAVLAGGHRGWSARLARGAAAIPAAAAGLLLLAYLTGEPLFYGGSFIPPAATTSGAFVALGVGLLFLARPRERRSKDRVRLPAGTEATLAGLFLALATGIILTGVSWAREEERRFRAQADREVSAIADLKAGEIVRWRAERLGNGLVLRGNSALLQLARRAVDGTGSPSDAGLLEEWLERIQQSYGYEEVQLVAPDGGQRLIVPNGARRPCSELQRRLPQVLASGETVFLDFHRDGPGEAIHLGVLTPLHDEPSGVAIGAVALRIDPGAFLFPFVSHWPVPSRSAETLLVRREGRHALFLNELRFAPGSALTLRVPLSKADDPVTRAALGEEGVGRGPDYRGVSVLAATRVVPGSEWGLVARVDVSEAYAPLRERLWLTVLLMAGLVAAVGGGVWAVWRRQLGRLERESRLAEAERDWLHDVIERSLNEIFVFDPGSLEFLFVNRGAAQNLGYSDEELHRMTPLDIKPELDEESFRAILRSASEGEKRVHRFETVHRRRDGSNYPVEVTLQFVSRGPDDVVLAVVNDITQRRWAESRIRRLNRVYSVLSDVNQTIVRERNPEALCREACRIAVEKGGFREAWLGTLEANSDRPRVLARVLAGGTVVSDVSGSPDGSDLAGMDLALEALRTGARLVSGGAAVAVAVAVLPLVVEGEVAGVLTLVASGAGLFDEEELQLLDEMAMDLGFALETGRREEARRKAEEEVRTLNADLERRVAERTADLAAAVKELETFAYSVSHDLKAPLRAVDGYSQILLEEHAEALNTEGKDYLLRLRRGAQRMGQLVEALLAYSRIERRALHLQEVDVADVVRSVLGELQEEIHATGAQVTVDVDGLAVRADYEGLAVVLRNLVGNAIKYSQGSQPPLIGVRASSEGGRTRLCVQDNGIGFDMAYHDRIFEIFQRLHRVEDFAGTGIGLALVQKAVERMKGRVWAESEPGRGATFFVELPG